VAGNVSAGGEKKKESSKPAGIARNHILFLVLSAEIREIRRGR
jgi:hypothetical protein